MKVAATARSLMTVPRLHVGDMPVQSPDHFSNVPAVAAVSCTDVPDSVYKVHDDEQVSESSDTVPVPTIVTAIDFALGDANRGPRIVDPVPAGTTHVVEVPHEVRLFEVSYQPLKCAPGSGIAVRVSSVGDVN